MAEEIEEVPEEEQEEDSGKKKKGDKMSLGAIIGIIAGVILLQVILIVAIVQIFFSDSDDQKPTREMADGEYELTEEELEVKEFLSNEENMRYMETGKIVTNPKLSKNYVAINVGLDYSPRPEVAEEELDAASTKMIKLNAKIKSDIIMLIGQMDTEELQQKRNLLPGIIKDSLAEKFKSEKLLLREVLISEFVIQ
ncbi:MAG: hypothetical protein Kapaf2KO_21610 [Candidatus Kapaibacteriales bacterium]